MLKELNVILPNVKLERMSVNNAETLTTSSPNPRSTINIISIISIISIIRTSKV